MTHLISEWQPYLTTLIIKSRCSSKVKSKIDKCTLFTMEVMQRWSKFKHQMLSEMHFQNVLLYYEICTWDLYHVWIPMINKSLSKKLFVSCFKSIWMMKIQCSREKWTDNVFLFYYNTRCIITKHVYRNLPLQGCLNIYRYAWLARFNIGWDICWKILELLANDCGYPSTKFSYHHTFLSKIISFAHWNYLYYLMPQNLDFIYLF